MRKISILTLFFVFIVNNIFSAYDNESFDNVPCVIPPESINQESYVMFVGRKNYDTHFYGSGIHDENIWGGCQYVKISKDSIYIKNLMNYGIPSGWWIKGAIKDNKVTFSRNDIIGRVINNNMEYERCYLYLFTCEDGALNPSHDPDYYYNLDEDLVMDYDPVDKTLSNPNHRFCFLPVEKLFSPAGRWTRWLRYYSDPSKDYTYGECYYDRILLKPCSDIPQIPNPPQIKIVKLNGEDYFQLTGDYYGIDDILLNPTRLWYKIYIDGELIDVSNYTMEQYEGYNFYRNVCDGLWYRVIWAEDEDLPRGRKMYVKVPDREYHIVYATLVYRMHALNEEYESLPGYLNNSGLDDIKEENEADGAVYDLTGRRVSRDNLAPGIYISKGQKFIVK